MTSHCCDHTARMTSEARGPSPDKRPRNQRSPKRKGPREGPRALRVRERGRTGSADPSRTPARFGLGGAGRGVSEQGKGDGSVGRTAFLQLPVRAGDLGFPLSFATSCLGYGGGSGPVQRRLCPVLTFRRFEEGATPGGSSGRAAPAAFLLLFTRRRVTPFPCEICENVSWTPSVPRLTDTAVSANLSFLALSRCRALFQ